MARALALARRGLGETNPNPMVGCVVVKDGRDAAARSWFARALATNPHFSLRWSPIARRYAS